ncbi:hypothetical protein [Rugamonas sp.]|uniref:hypothetical protein n=1 Tax=Rugamonas sp. TaxID=1926287 RepID=UPI0025E14BFE|nr:hypothetical protein [Rugamonas sp.]
MENLNTDYRIIVHTETETSIPWPEGTPAPLVGDTVIFRAGPDAFGFVVQHRMWDVGLDERLGRQTAVLIITGQSQAVTQERRAVVRPLPI